jgi:predicted glycogen debranching enzyme
MPRIAALHDGAYHHEPYWFREFLYEEERARGQDFSGDLASPGELRFDLARGEAWCLFGTDDAIDRLAARSSDARACGVELAEAEAKSRARFASVPERSAEAFLVERGDGRTIIAGYPWFCDWGRDTFISMRGLCFALERWDEARAILLEWSRTVSQGMLPNRFVEAGETAEYNSVDASLWFVVAAGELFEAARAGRAELPGSSARRSRARSRRS